MDTVMKKDGLRWGILATGGIANKFADALKCVPGAELAAVGSRAKETAEKFGERHGIPKERCFGNYEEFAACPDVDIVYVASPHSHHAEHSLLALRAGKHVLAEKSFTLNPAQAEKVFGEARARGLFACEAMWTRFLPVNRELKSFLESGTLGKVHTAWASFGAHFPDDWPLTHRIYDPKLGGGALLDMGVYPASWLSMIAGDREPSSIQTTGKLFAPTGCDERSVTVCSYENGPETVAACAIKTKMEDTGRVFCEKGYIVMPSFWNAEKFLVRSEDGKEYEVHPERHEQGFVHEIVSVTEDILAGRTESSVVPQSATMCVQRILERARLDLGFRYDCER